MNSLFVSGLNCAAYLFNSFFLWLLLSKFPDSLVFFFRQFLQFFPTDFAPVFFLQCVFLQTVHTVLPPRDGVSQVLWPRLQVQTNLGTDAWTIFQTFLCIALVYFCFLPRIVLLKTVTLHKSGFKEVGDQTISQLFITSGGPKKRTEIESTLSYIKHMLPQTISKYVLQNLIEPWTRWPGKEFEETVIWYVEALTCLIHPSSKSS